MISTGFTMIGLRLLEEHGVDLVVLDLLLVLAVQDRKRWPFPTPRPRGRAGGADEGVVDAEQGHANPRLAAGLIAAGETDGEGRRQSEAREDACRLL